jgi:hypothetical protein
MATAIGSISNIIKEELSYVRKETEPEVDGIFQAMHDSSQGVSAGIGRDWKVIHTFSTGLAGQFKNITAVGPSNTAKGQVYTWDAAPTRTFGALSESSTPGTVQKTIELVQGMGNFHLPFQYFAADELTASIADAVAIAIRGCAKQVNQSEANHFYTNEATEKSIFEATTAATCVTTNGAATIVCDLSVDTSAFKGRIGRIMPGMKVDWIDSSESPDIVIATGGANCTITKVDYINKTFSCQVASDTLTIGDGDYMVQSGTTIGVTENTTIGPKGAEYWLVSGSSDVYGINQTNHPQFNSLVAAVSGVLDEATLNKYVGGFYDAYGGMFSLDSLITTTGVLTAYMESIDGLYRYQRNNQRLQIKEGWSSMDYAWNGQEFQMMASRYQAPGQAYIIKTGDQNIKRYTPPKVSSTTGRGEFPNDLQFVAPWMGSNTIFLPVEEGSSAATTGIELTEFVQAPFLYMREWCPDQLNGVKLTGLTESNP